MKDPKKAPDAEKAKTLPTKDPKGENVKGGLLRTGGDDDLEDLEVER